MSVSLSGKRGRYVRQVTGRHNDTDLHVAARAGDAAALRRALDEAAVVVAVGEGGEQLEAVRRAVAAEANEAGETPLLAAAERGHLEVVVELLRHLDAQGVATKNRSGYDALHVAAREGHHGEVPSSPLCCKLRIPPVKLWSLRELRFFVCWVCSDCVLGTSAMFGPVSRNVCKSVCTSIVVNCNTKLGIASFAITCCLGIFFF